MLRAERKRLRDLPKTSLLRRSCSRSPPFCSGQLGCWAPLSRQRLPPKHPWKPGTGLGGGAGLEEGVSPTPKTQRQDNHLSAPVDPQPSLPEISRPKNLKENSGVGKRWGGGGQLNENKREEPALVMGQTISIFGVRQNGRGLTS